MRVPALLFWLYALCYVYGSGDRYRSNIVESEISKIGKVCSKVLGGEQHVFQCEPDGNTAASCQVHLLGTVVELWEGRRRRRK